MASTAPAFMGDTPSQKIHCLCQMPADHMFTHMARCCLSVWRTLLLAFYVENVSDAETPSLLSRKGVTHICIAWLEISQLYSQVPQPLLLVDFQVSWGT